MKVGIQKLYYYNFYQQKAWVQMFPQKWSGPHIAICHKYVAPYKCPAPWP